MMMTRMVTLMVTMVMMAIQVTMIDKPAYLVIRFLFGFTSDSDSQTQQILKRQCYHPLAGLNLDETRPVDL